MMAGRDEDWVVRPVTGQAARKTYVCPSCNQDIPSGTPHVVAWHEGWATGVAGSRRPGHTRRGALTRTATIVADTPVTLFKIRADSLHKASENCQLRFNRSFMNILVDRLAQATSELATGY